MEPDLSGFKEVHRRDDGTKIVISVVGDGSDLRASLTHLIGQLPDGAEISAIEVGPAECYHEVRAWKSGFMLKRGCHGSFGTWAPCSGQEAIDWLLPGFESATRNSQIEPANISISKWQFNSGVTPVLWKT